LLIGEGADENGKSEKGGDRQRSIPALVALLVFVTQGKGTGFSPGGGHQYDPGWW